MKSLSDNTKRFALKFYRAIGTPLAMRLFGAVERSEWDTVASCVVTPGDYTDSQEYFLDATAASLLRKCKDLPTSFDLVGNALKNWRNGEADCYKTNERLSPYLEGFTHPDWNADIAHHLDELRKKIAEVLGRCPAMDHLEPRHGPGATFSDKAKKSTIADKMQQPASLTHTAFWFLLDWVGTAWGREALQNGMNPIPVRGNRFTTAPKDAMKDRPIAAEPSINIFYQLALGRELRRALKRVGIDLDVASDIHRQVACESSISGSTATLDLSNASDTVAYNLVRLLLPADWFRMLDELRSGFTLIPPHLAAGALGRNPCLMSINWFKLEKFSSMGNGFTFELESLLFWAISDYATSVALEGQPMEKTRVFGDDIICDSRGVENVVALLRFLGFSINRGKSFIGGVFKESCGGDYWGGRPVRPIYLKESLDEPQQLIAACNQVRKVAYDLFGGLGPLTSAWFHLQDQLPSGIRRCRGPQGLGDNVIHDNEVKWSWTSSARVKIHAYQPVSHLKVELENYAPGIIHACGLYGTTVSLGYLIPRESVTGYAVRKIYPFKCEWLPEPRIIRGGPRVVTTVPSPTGPLYGDLTRVIKGTAFAAIATGK